MKTPIGPLMRHCNGLMFGALWALCWCVLPVSGAQAGSGSVQATITEISLERNCSACPTASVLVLRRAGTAVLTQPGKARLGTVTRVSRGTIAADEFDALAQLIVERGYFALSDSYEDPSLRDGSWAVMRVLRGAQDKQVFRREDAAPEALQAIEAAIIAVQARIRFNPDAP